MGNSTTAAELGQGHVGRTVRFHADGAPVRGVISKVDTEHYDCRVLVELGDLDNLYNLAPAQEITFI